MHTYEMRTTHAREGSIVEATNTNASTSWRDILMNTLDWVARNSFRRLVLKIIGEDLDKEFLRPKWKTIDTVNLATVTDPKGWKPNINRLEHLFYFSIYS